MKIMIYRERREKTKPIKKSFLFLPLSYSAILHVESHCSTIVYIYIYVYIFFQHLHFTTSNGVGILGLNCKIGQHLRIARKNQQKFAKCHAKTNHTSTRVSDDTSSLAHVSDDISSLARVSDDIGGPIRL